MSFYPKVTTDPTGSTPASPRFPELEKRVLEYWKNDDTFQASIDQREGEEFVFYDGPPFANGLPHYGHLLTGYVKDLVARYQTQRGKRVERRFGWDTHGLPAELEAMKQLGMTDKKQIEAMGIDKFNDACRTSVMKYADEWKQYVNRQARWVDFENDYKTLNVEFMESVIWAFKQLSDKGLTYQGFRVLPYCWKDETPLSNHELRMDDDVYKNRQDQTVTVGFTILAGETEASKALAGVQALAWTTTPWTLPTNAALAVHPSIEYVVVPAGEAGVKASAAAGPFLLAKDLLGSYAKDLGYEDAKEAAAAITATFAGADLAGVRYQPLWDTYTDTEKYGTQNAWQIVTADYVTVADGTGIVHQAPAYGEDDQKVCEENGIPVIISVDEGAKFLSVFAGGPLADIVGVQVFDANKTITNVLKDEAKLIKQASYEHSYPHCWRCRTPLIYRAISSWYVEVSKFKDRMVELNEQINWIPGNVKHGQFGKWLENARDWSISRNRYWGSPIPVWECTGAECTHREVFGSLDELKNFFGRLPLNHEGQPDLHRPFIDELTKAHEGCAEGGTLVRVEDVLDVWFDSGSMPYAQVHYPFNNQDWFDSGHHPADFIVEYIGQTRGWFYTMHVLSTALFDRPAYTNVISHGIVLGSDGQKMSKSLRNYPDVNEVLDRDGSDAMRWFLMASPILRGGNLVVTEQGIRDGVRQVLLPLWNVWHFFNLYTNSANNGAGYEAKRSTSSTDPLDQYMLAATGQLVRDVTVALDTYEVSDATEAVRQYMDTLTNWYVRRSRQRFFDEDTQAFDTLYTALETLVKVTASLLPLASEEIYRGLTGQRSVHMTDWPDANEFPTDASSLETMETTRRICSVGSSLRKAKNLRVRLPLAELKIVLAGAARLDGTYASIIKDELNLKAVTLIDAEGVDAASYGISQQLVVNARAAGPRLGKNVQQAIKGAKSGDWSVTDGVVTAGGLELVEGEYTLDTVVDAEGDIAAAVIDGGFLVLDTEVTEALAAEGTARDMVRSIQSARKDADLQVSDRIQTVITANAATIAALEANRELISGETLTAQLELRVDENAKAESVSVQKLDTTTAEAN
ncbi:MULTISPECIES: isoleucine--tRNA ligase [unclassified Glutamicibacter]|uniref:isoleucine--tRNA ligase n=1 Tax=unclassified Glutamicibacter TaxID=2627139 RepID=UPI0021CAA225|nr:isoleucine--tRNA ligase [Glutamicibacter sp. M10]UXN30881.1 isoleucine--tRNA ligase [Glutamicibacter sp. M10]